MPNVNPEIAITVETSTLKCQNIEGTRISNFENVVSFENLKYLASKTRNMRDVSQITLEYQR